MAKAEMPGGKRRIGSPPEPALPSQWNEGRKRPLTGMISSPDRSDPRQRRVRDAALLV